MRVLIADQFESWGIDKLRESGCEVALEPKLDGDALRDAIVRTRCAVLIVRGTKITAPMLSASDALSLVVRAGAGYNTIDVAAASQRSILVANCPGKNSIAVAELTFGLILALDRRIVDNTVELWNGRWNKKEFSKARGLKGRTLGIIGLGEIGQAVARRAHAFEMRVAGWSRSLTSEMAERLDVVRCGSPVDVASKCDLLTIHLAAAPETRNIINGDVLNRLAPGSYVINTARAEVMDYKALAVAVKERHLRVALDVYPDEPSGGEAAFRAAILEEGGMVYGTHHIGASTDQAQDAIANETVRIVQEYRQTGRVFNCVNLAAKSRARYVIVVRHRNQPGVLAHTLNEISQAGVNVEEMDNVICEGGESACARIKLAAPLDDALLRRIHEGNKNVFGVGLYRVKD
ncbi:MAG: NAD(P)-dependent oxidoreductase [Phycisphaerales bacterium]|nr:NAD(P)-dependent oxidoreductase [Phycisphaerales bacterium]